MVDHPHFSWFPIGGGGKESTPPPPMLPQVRNGGVLEKRVDVVAYKGVNYSIIRHLGYFE